eukprot:TRINITY_DN6832_c1_g1_i1.p1 TRINITY_DN6832_c1_g1~~TRINITY_DN6832_c1_g1_i1.p1  ORF type:complete len:442 (-),score=107.52 TRINITY_DN6832_c1_g1_i1:130-1455(-)
MGPNFGAALDGQGLLFVWGEASDDEFVGPVAVDVRGEARGMRFDDVQCSSTKVFVKTRQGHVFVFDALLEALRDRAAAASTRPAAAAESAAAAGGASAAPAGSSSEALPLTAAAVPGLPTPGLWSRVRGGRGGVKQMSIGMEHAAFVTHRGELLCYGGSEWGQCGVAPPKQKGPQGALEDRVRVEVDVPRRVHFPPDVGPIDCVAVGGRHTVAVSEEGRVFAFGDDRRIQLGIGDTRSAGTDKRHAYGVINPDHLGGVKVNNEIKKRASYRYYDPHMQSVPLETVPPVAYNRPKYPPPCLVACGEDFTIAVHRDSPDWFPEEEETRLLFHCGENGFGQGGRNWQQQQQVWSIARLPKRSKTLQVACGQAHVLALLSNGELYAWGSNLEGQVGNASRANSATPVRIDVPAREAQAQAPPEQRKIVSIAGGFRTSAVICEAPR